MPPVGREGVALQGVGGRQPPGGAGSPRFSLVGAAGGGAERSRPTGCLMFGVLGEVRRTEGGALGAAGGRRPPDGEGGVGETNRPVFMEKEGKRRKS